MILVFSTEVHSTCEESSQSNGQWSDTEPWSVPSLAHSPFLSEAAPMADINPAIMTILQNICWKASVWKDYDIPTKLIANTCSDPQCVRFPSEINVNRELPWFQMQKLTLRGSSIGQRQSNSWDNLLRRNPRFLFISISTKHTGTNDVFRWSLLFLQFRIFVESKIFKYFVLSSVKG